VRATAESRWRGTGASSRRSPRSRSAESRGEYCLVEELVGGDIVNRQRVLPRRPLHPADRHRPRAGAAAGLRRAARAPLARRPRACGRRSRGRDSGSRDTRARHRARTEHGAGAARRQRAAAREGVGTRRRRARRRALPRRARRRSQRSRGLVRARRAGAIRSSSPPTPVSAARACAFLVAPRACCRTYAAWRRPTPSTVCAASASIASPVTCSARSGAHPTRRRRARDGRHARRGARTPRAARSGTFAS